MDVLGRDMEEKRVGEKEGVRRCEWKVRHVWGGGD